MGQQRRSSEQSGKRKKNITLRGKKIWCGLKKTEIVQNSLCIAIASLGELHKKRQLHKNVERESEH